MKYIYPSKLLLFGEYTVLAGSQALAVPYPEYRGEWKQLAAGETASAAFLLPYLEWLEERDMVTPDICRNIRYDVEEGWTFASNIPIGYGLGSSGAFVAALYDRYFRDSETHAHAEMPRMLAAMESYFHGTSSGMDPLVSYLKKGMYRDESGHFHEIDDPGWPDGWQVSLLDSGTGRTTGPLVASFKEKMQDPEFETGLKQVLIPAVEHAIHFYLAGEAAMLEECISVVSRFQRRYFEEWIPDAIRAQWDESAENQGAYVKFCGAGGGGYFMRIDAGQSQNKF